MAQRHVVCDTLDVGPGPEEALNIAVAVTVIRTWEGGVVEGGGAWWDSSSGLDTLREKEHHLNIAYKLIRGKNVKAPKTVQNKCNKKRTAKAVHKF